MEAASQPTVAEQGVLPSQHLVHFSLLLISYSKLPVEAREQEAHRQRAAASVKRRVERGEGLWCTEQ